MATKRSSFKPASESLGFLLADTTRLMRRVSAIYLEEHQITVAQMRALIYVGRREGIRQVELADLLEIQPITLARLIDQLSKSGLVERRSDPKDRRAFQLYLTDAAAPLIAFIGERSERFQQQAFEGLTADQIETFFISLNKVHNNLSALLRNPQHLRDGAHS
ncbi:MAG: MarR family transcriptional regulator [Moraxellaceae bacterium]|nr:MAG: MarR family transcriptional regulator [Moraxellaceae bacterium]